MIHENVKACIEGTPCEIEYTDDNGKVIGYWAYGAYDPNLPYQGEVHFTEGQLKWLQSLKSGKYPSGPHS